jgi:broad specificity phosphatase PhoE
LQRIKSGLLERVKFGATVLCTHGDVIAHLLQYLNKRGIVEDDDARKMKKGSTWVVDFEEGQPVGAHYLPPPA